jgi:trans-aconitate methyltransferase
MAARIMPFMPANISCRTMMVNRIAWIVSIVRLGRWVLMRLTCSQVHYHAVRLTLENKLFLAPIENPSAVFDVGTGTGIWAMDCADDYPDAQVLGIDLSPIQPSFVPPNLQFEIFDLEEPWDRNAQFDLVHTRLMNGFSVKSWANFYEQAFLALKPVAGLKIKSLT